MIHKTTSTTSASNKTSTPPVSNYLIHVEGGILRVKSDPPADLEAELARMGYQLIVEGDSQWVSSYRQPETNDFAVIIRQQHTHYLILLGGLYSYRNFMKDFTVTPGVFHLLIAPH